jgi:hypothetical protein
LVTDAQAAPHRPQLAASFCASTQSLPQRTRPATHTKSHVPALQTGVSFGVAVHCTAQPPQFAASFFVFTHSSPHTVSVTLHESVPELPPLPSMTTAVSPPLPLPATPSDTPASGVGAEDDVLRRALGALEFTQVFVLPSHQ